VIPFDQLGDPGSGAMPSFFSVLIQAASTVDSAGAVVVFSQDGLWLFVLDGSSSHDFGRDLIQGDSRFTG
jgi:hypothetical protein